MQATKILPDFILQVKFTMESNILVLFGPSGCGKTTILRCIAGLIKPDTGRIVYNNQVFFDSETGAFVPSRHRNIGYMFQDFALFPHMSVRKNVLYGVKQSGVHAVELYEKLMGLLKIEHLARRYIDRLSGGEKQRVALARALMAEPRILLLDEPLSSLDSETRMELRAELKKLQELWGIPFILVTHDREEAEILGDQILFISKGQLISQTFPCQEQAGLLTAGCD